MEDWPGATVGVAYALTGVSFFIIISRSILRRLKHEDQLLDDYLMLLSIVFYAITTATNPVAYFKGTNVRVEQVRRLLPLEIEDAVLGSRYVFIGRLFYVTYIWLLKACMVIFYTRIVTDSHIEQLLLQGTFVLLGVTWLACIFQNFLGCDPLQLYWQVIPETPRCAQGVANSLVAGSLHVFTNVLLMALPIPAILRAKFPVRSLIHVSTIFLTNIFLITVVIIRMVIVSRRKPQWQAQELIWRQVDCFLMTVIVNKPILYRLWRHGINHIRKGKFGVNACSTGYSPPVENQEPRAEAGRGGDRSNFSTLQEKIRSSAQSITNKARKSVGLPVGEIERTVELLQTSRTGNLEEEDAEQFGQADDAIFGGKSGPIAKISTTVSRGGVADVPRSQRVARKFRVLNNKTEEEGPSALNTNVADVARTRKAAKKFLALNKKPEEGPSALRTDVADVARTQQAGKKFAALKGRKKDAQEVSAQEDTTA